MSTTTTFKPGDVLRYAPYRDHCRQTSAFVTEDGTPLDTYWGTYGDGQYGHLREEELASAKVVFNVNDYEALDQYSSGSRLRWLTFHPDDRRTSSMLLARHPDCYECRQAADGRCWHDRVVAEKRAVARPRKRLPLCPRNGPTPRQRS